MWQSDYQLFDVFIRVVVANMAALERKMLVVIIATLWCSASAVDRGNFKTCDQSGFCKRQRAMEPGNSPYQAMLDTVQIEPTKISLDLLNTRSKVKLRAEVIALEGNMVRLRINEINPLYPRYEPPVGDVLVEDPAQQKLDVQKDGSTVTLVFRDNKVVLHSQPFRIDFFIKDEPVISVNTRGLLKFEHYRAKSQGILGSVLSWFSRPFRPAENGEGEQQPEEPAVEEEKDENGLWEETFKGHADSKQRGPSSVGLDFSFPGFEYVYGIPEHADSLALKSTKNTDPYRLFNLDVFEYEVNNPMALYKSVPLMLAHNEKKTVGLFWLNAAETWVDIISNVADKNIFSKLTELWHRGDDVPQVDTHWMSESGIIDAFFLLGPTPKMVFHQYARLTGTTPLPPLFSIAYHQSRWNYNDQQDVANVANGFDEHNIPMDVIWLDIEHTDGKRYFTWDANKFPNSIEMIQSVAAKGRKMVTIVDPHIKKDDNYKVYKDARDKNLYVKNKDGNDYDGWCWPGSSAWPDFLNPEVRKWWANNFKFEEYVGSTSDLYVWNDMNEPSVFNGPEITMHKDAKHYGDFEHRDVHNIYGMYVHQATYEGLLLRSNNQLRPFVLSRAAFAGSQRFGAVWTGDNTGEWSHLQISLPMVMSLNLAGVTFSGADIGGFFKNPDAELLTRWYQTGAYQPFFRAHAHLDTRRREPWLLPEENLRAVRDVIRERYALLPYWYTLFYKGEREGGPIMSPLWVEFPNDKLGFAVENEHMVGPALLVHPVTTSGASNVNVYFPEEGEIWYDAKNYMTYKGREQHYYAVDLFTVPVFQRGGTIIPRRERPRRSSGLTHNDPFTLVAALNNKGEARGDLYVDDYQSFKYKQGEYLHREFTFENSKFTARSADKNGQFSTPAWLERIQIVGLMTAPSVVELTTSEGSSHLGFKYESSKKLLTIRKPGVNIAEDFTISLQ